ncbi:hypothetical protein M409DRAFT_21366 [Zasmidium cellare ATCC 36951]|uniref:Uncharacterized protein n=1 Tax=Zasmidium cellare ATCC 36951 TaxID=1080233 RepID=A0A6A6CR53_ZASCE|nr:uncharacterized protein M409DRAFT_21366 [Zasmidium cellare ATCC 36951]KAF2168620.1 hypothetical protein M409DRAFT_21366 [Zasmidium cellare ATCC 36951]
MDNNNEGEALEFRSVTLVVAPNRLPRYDEGWIPAHRDLCLTEAEIQREEEDEEDEEDIKEMEGRGDRMELSFEGRRALYEFLGVLG